MADPDVKEKPATMKQKIVLWARARMGQKVDTGECWDLAELALKNNGAKTSTDLGKVGKDTDYVWGTLKTTSQVVEGDVLQFRDYRYRVDIEIKTTFSDGAWYTDKKFDTRDTPHHTAIAAGMIDKSGMVKILEQNAKPSGKKVQEYPLYTHSIPTKTKTEDKLMKHPQSKKMVKATVVTKTTITVSGKIWVYAPIKKDAP